MESLKGAAAHAYCRKIDDRLRLSEVAEEKPKAK
jgi:hypothetical protein